MYITEQIVLFIKITEFLLHFKKSRMIAQQLTTNN